jgi:hypothetical protein
LSTLTAQQTLLEIPTPTMHHAFMIAPVIAHDPGKGDLIDLELPDGTFLRTQAAPDVFHLGPNINGPWDDAARVCVCERQHAGADSLRVPTSSPSTSGSVSQILEP